VYVGKRNEIVVAIAQKTQGESDMKYHRALVLALAFVAAMSGQIFGAETKVVVSSMHICCKSCVDGITKALTAVPDVKFSVDKDSESVALMAKDTAAAQAAVDALAGAGYHGKTDSKEVMMKESTGVPDGKVTKLEVSDIHNCCGKCTSAIDKAVKAVPGVKSTNAKAKITTFTVEGDFEAKAVVKALSDAGFHATFK
jgi:mercuric ion binding protein